MAPKCRGGSGAWATIAMEILQNVTTLTIDPGLPLDSLRHVRKLHVCPAACDVEIVRSMAVMTKVDVDEDVMCKLPGVTAPTDLFGDQHGTSTILWEWKAAGVCAVKLAGRLKGQD